MRVLRTIRLAGAAGVVCLVAGGAVASVPVAHAAPAAPAMALSTGYVTNGVLTGVAATSPTNAWAVGSSYTGKDTGKDIKTLILHWNGKSWTKAPGFRPVIGALLAVAAISAANAWAVGYTGVPSTGITVTTKTLILHWNGRVWAAVSTPKPVAGEFAGVSMGAGLGWAVGSTSTAGYGWRWDGTSWHPAAMPAFAYPRDVAVVSSSNAWAAGLDFVGPNPAPMMAHWDGSAWRLVKIPISGARQILYGVAAGPGGTVLAVGVDAATFAPLSIRWTGKSWVKAPVAMRVGFLNAVTFFPGGTAWAVTAYGSAPFMRWNGKTWVQVAGPHAAVTYDLLGVAAAGARDAWAVGSQGSYLAPKTVIVHWNGRSWS
jgi:hypothetical protein